MTDNLKTRRQFFKEAGLVAAAGTLLACDDEVKADPIDPASARKAALTQYRPLGKIGKKVSKIGLGTGSLTEPAVLEQAIDLGLNYIDTAACYGDGQSETVVGKVLKRRRDEVFVTTKWHPAATDKRDMMLKSLDDSLKRLQTDHVDAVLVHSVGEVERIRNPEVFEAFRIAKQAGKVSHLGASSHSATLIEVMRDAIALKQYELVLMKYSFMAYPKLEALIDELHAAGIAVTVMKTRDGARDGGIKEFQKGDGFMATALRWASSNKKVASTVMSIKTFDDVNTIAKVAGQELASRDLEVLRQYAQTFDSVQCRWCDECGPACPSAVPVWDVDRAAMYYDRYGDQRRGMELYHELGRPAAGCASCSAPCESACSFGIPIKSQMVEAHRLLDWASKDRGGARLS
jgi:predicted aldo/keto reductase-like oxidoreductase